MSKQSEFTKCLMAQIGGYRKKIHGEEFFSPRQKELFPGLKRDLNMEIEDAARSDDPLEACMERRGYKPSKTQVFQEAISAKLTADMFGKQEKLTGAEAMFQEQMQECLDRLKNKPKLKFGLSGDYDTREKLEKRFEIVEEVLGQHSGQMNLVKYAVDRKTGMIEAKVDFSVYKGKAYIDWIEVSEDLQKQGIGRQLIKELQSEYPKIQWGYTTGPGTALKKAVKRLGLLGRISQFKKGDKVVKTHYYYTPPDDKIGFLTKVWDTDKGQWGTVFYGKNQSGQRLQNKYPLSVFKKVEAQNKKSIPEQTDFINPSQMTLFGALRKQYTNVSRNYLSIGDKVKYKNKMATVIETTRDHPRVVIQYDKSGKEEIAYVDKILLQYETEKKITEKAGQMTLFGRLILRKLAMQRKG